MSHTTATAPTATNRIPVSYPNCRSSTCAGWCAACHLITHAKILRKPGTKLASASWLLYQTSSTQHKAGPRQPPPSPAREGHRVKSCARYWCFPVRGKYHSCPFDATASISTHCRPTRNLESRPSSEDVPFAASTLCYPPCTGQWLCAWAAGSRYQLFSLRAAMRAQLRQPWTETSHMQGGGKAS